jgi:beta-glucanase (GH16 family)
MPPDPTHWNYDLGGGGWGNGEQEVYTNSTNNAFQDGKGNLVIRAIKDSSGNFTSARLLTGIDNSSDAVNLSWQYGKIEARIKLPFGAGVWPAFWMLGNDYSTVSWPQCGEIDILENFGANFEDASTVHGTIHGPNFADAGVGAPYHLPNQEKFTDDYHLFSIEWSANAVNFFVDGTNYESLTPSSLPAGGQWVFNQPFFIILNLAIGGPSTFLGTPQPNTPFPQDMLIDYVRVYNAVNVPSTKPAIAPGGILNAASGLGTIAPGSLVSLYGVNLADATYGSLFESGKFVSSTPSGVSVSVNGKSAPLTYVSPSQINFQLPWETELAPQTVNVAVTWNSNTSDMEAVTLRQPRRRCF